MFAPCSCVNQGADGRHAQIGEYLRRASAGARFCGPESLLSCIAEASAGPRKNEDGEESCEPPRPGTNEERNADQGSSQRPARGDSSNCAAKARKNDGNQGENPRFAEILTGKAPRNIS